MKKQTINIITLKWGSKYGSHYVNKLFSGIKRNTNHLIKLHCFTDNSSGLNKEIISHTLPYNKLDTWWNKLYFFSNDMPFKKGEKLFYIDLDTLVVNNIDHILEYDPDTIIVLRDFYTGLAKSVIGNDNIGSGLMYWKHGDYSHIWDNFIINPKLAMERVKPHGDQRWIQECIKERFYWQDLFPDQISSFKVHCNNGLPNKTRIVCYHGKPSIPESYSQRNRIWKFDIFPQAWVKLHWRE